GRESGVSRMEKNRDAAAQGAVAHGEVGQAVIVEISRSHGQWGAAPVRRDRRSNSVDGHGLEERIPGPLGHGRQGGCEDGGKKRVGDELRTKRAHVPSRVRDTGRSTNPGQNGSRKWGWWAAP